MINQGMDHHGFAIVHVQSPCTTYNDTFDLIKGNSKKGIEPTMWELPEDHDPADRRAAYEVIQKGGLPIGIIYQDADRPSFDQMQDKIRESTRQKSVEQLMESFLL